MLDIKIDKKKCIGCGTCAALAPEIFKMCEDGKAEALNSNKEVDEEMARLACSSCPTTAIKINE